MIILKFDHMFTKMLLKGCVYMTAYQRWHKGRPVPFSWRFFIWQFTKFLFSVNRNAWMIYTFISLHIYYKCMFVKWYSLLYFSLQLSILFCCQSRSNTLTCNLILYYAFVTPCPYISFRSSTIINSSASEWNDLS